MQTLAIFAAIALSNVGAVVFGAAILRLLLFLTFEAAPRRRTLR